MADITPKLALFCDEAGKDTDRYLAVGGLVVAHSDVAAIRAEFIRRKTALGLNKEAKWNATRKPTLEKHRSLIKWTFDLIRKRELLFHCLLVDFERFDHGLREDGGKAESMKRMYYQLILHRLLKKHGREYDCYALIDKCNELTGLERFRTGLNTDSKRFKCDGALKVIEFRDSEKEPLLQMNDLILGAVCAHRNRRFEEAGAGQYKANLAGYVLGKFDLLNFDGDTPRAQDTLSIWNLKSEHMRGGAGA